MNLKEKLASLNLEEQKHTINFDELVGEMLANIGSTDPELRDSLIYSTFYRLIKSDCLTETQMENLLDACLGEQYLFYNMGEKEGDSVFTRSFSSLVLALLL